MTILKRRNISSPAHRTLRQLNAAEIQLVSGGINPQPLPPNHPPEARAK